MSFLVCHIEKYKRGNLYGLQKHEQRENKNYSNKSVDLQRTKFNYDLANNKKINYLNRADEIINSQRVSKKAVRKDAVIAIGVIVSSDKDFFDKLDKTKQDKFFRDSLDYFKENFSDKNIISANIHLDESTPHMHLNFVPMTSDGCLSAKKVITKAKLRELQRGLPAYLKTKGFDIERGVENNQAKHIEITELKNQTFKELSKEYDVKLNALKKAIDVSKNDEKILSDLKSIKTKKSILGGNISLNEGDYNKIVDLASRGLAREKEISNLKEKIKALENTNCELKNKNSSLNFDKNNLNKRVDELKELVKVAESKHKKVSDSLHLATRFIKSVQVTLNEHDLMNEAKKLFEKDELERNRKLNRNKNIGL
ncbi:MobV family relaxase [Clostridium autoethanogenum]|uniref:Plasmid recombination protein n=1 Tax=Clostridium autoethanogenum DSM 10061 TaxID=1341692 RepID=A0ABY4TRB6_9CLOT|nr:MobV family relaxase [Clostridium autoethanogenum]OVY48501.1 Plasmid recombination enzyme [Clostridium autoethanogenum]OVY48508.1 Plasmid recombination enzyme [Clostridium autoethanogenum]URS74509.1 plasmid recombination protein [Clostridium autoethanogenum DSM 10061]